LSFGEFGQGLTIGNDAAASKQSGRAAVATQLGTSNRYCPSAVAVTITPTNGTAITTSLHAFVLGDKPQCCIAWKPAQGWCR
jgi:hypothetical protein